CRQHCVGDLRARPSLFGDPPPRTDLAIGVDGGAVWNVGAQLRLSFNTVVDPVHPLVPPPKSFGDEVDSGPGSGLMGIVVGPWSQQRVNRRGFGVGAPATIRVVHEA